MNSPFISICIPAYKRIYFLKRLLDSIVIQSYKDYEVIISDDSNDDSVIDLYKEYENQLPINYFQNKPSLGTPANWNACIKKSNGEWIKIMHDDDWFTNKDSLSLFVEYTKKGNSFIFSSYYNAFENSTKLNLITASNFKIPFYLKTPMLLLAKNIIGPPSVTLIHKSILEVYDKRMKWRVDIDFYIRIISIEKTITFIPKPLVNVGVSESQVTNYCINIPSVEIPEGYLLLEKYGIAPLKNIVVYDAWWRIFRNLNITNVAQLEQFGQSPWNKIIVRMLKHLSIIPSTFLKIGILSKLFMSISYCINIPITKSTNR